ncbi:unnamed protein product [Caenorhabditis auriculariae]|uniref:G protein-coupled receptor n=1 Tax=Caenorhabditis auriculariae TaxID=2777116 RepID=A0A8S1H8A7_9PELO|nr:unnamed protein product [Caenorhabditis auriculariae]
MLTACTVFYALFLTIFSLVLELSHLLNDENQRKINTKDMIFGLYMYGCSLLFFLYMYIVLLLNPRWYSTMDYLKKLLSICFRPKKTSSSDSLSSAAATVRKVTHSSPSAGSLFLRLGCIVFGVVGVVYYAFLVFLCTSDDKCTNLSIALDVSAILFIFIQMHFIFCNWKLSITGSHMVSRLGTMHLIAANLWTWIRYVLMEESVMEKEIKEVFKNKNYSLSYDYESSSSSEEFGSSRGKHHGDTSGCQAAECLLGSVSEVMFTAIVEYSLIAAAVMYIVWRNIGRHNIGSTYVKRKHQIRVDCSKTTTGLFLGLAFLAFTFTSMVVYYGYTILKRSKHAAFVYAFTEIIQYVFSTIGCVLAIYQMRALKYFHKPPVRGPRDQELLDQILLSVGLVGELIYSVAGLVGLTGEVSWTPLVFTLLFVHICRLIQIGTQTFLLYVAKSVRIGSEDREAQPGKQAITFLLTANVSIFFMNLFESEKAGVSEIIINYYGKRSWVFLVRSFSPLTIFYRFHSSVCFAEIWKNVYATKSINGGVPPIPSSNSILYFTVLVSIFRSKALWALPCYRIMFFLGLSDSCCLIFCADFAGFYSIVGLHPCYNIHFTYVTGCLVFGLWHMSCAYVILLAFDRTCEIVAPHACRFLFEGLWFKILLSLPVFYFIYFTFFTKPTFFQPDISAFLLNPMSKATEGFDRGLYTVEAYLFNNFFVMISIAITYIFICSYLLFQTYSMKTVQTSSTKIARMVTYQSLIVCTCHFIGCFLYVYIQYFEMAPFFNVICHLAWIGNHSLPPVIYTLFNASLRAEMINLIFPKRKNNSSVILVEDITGGTKTA